MTIGTLTREAPARPVALTPIFGNMPAELKSLHIWVVWQYQQRKDKWRKVPYIAMSGRQIKAKSNDDRTWRSYDEAKKAYLAGGFDGVGIMVTGDLIGGDFDHCLSDGEISDFARKSMPPTYTERSPGGEGLRFLAYGSIARPHKTIRAEIYDKTSPRFLTLTGHRLENQPATIERCQDEIDRLETALASEPTAQRGTQTTNRTRARRERSRRQVAADIFPEDVRNEARQLYRTQGDNLERRFKAGAWKEKTQWWCVARREYAIFHELYPFVGLYDDAGVFDPSQARAATARAIKGLGFTLPEYAALMTRYFASDREQMIARWGDKDRWWEELADIWDKVAPAKRGFWQPKPDVAIPAKPKGRASDHGTQVENVYRILQEHRVGDKATIKTADIAAEADIHRVTLAGILAELRRSGRITTERLGRYGGLTVSFSDVAIPDELPIAAPTNTALIEETHTPHCVSSKLRRSATACRQLRRAGRAARRQSLRNRVTFYLDRYTEAPRDRLDKTTGNLEPIAYRRSAKRCAGFIESQWPGRWDEATIRTCYRAIIAERRAAYRAEWQVYFKRLREMTADDLVAHVTGGLYAELRAAGHDGWDYHLYRTRLKHAKKALADRGLRLPARQTKLKKSRTTARPQVQPESTIEETDQRPFVLVGGLRYVKMLARRRESILAYAT